MKTMILLFLLLMTLAILPGDRFGPPQPPAGTDIQCMNDCLDRGYMWSYCRKVCSY